jgi:raffinose/stachyose/melibiose transport system substrate-binding protein
MENKERREIMKLKRLLSIVVLIALLVPGMLFATGSQEEKEIVLTWSTIWLEPDSKAAAVAALVNEFNTEYAGKYMVKMEGTVDYDGYRTKLSTQMAAGVVPDIFVFNPGPTEMKFYQGEKLMMDFADDLAGSWKNDFVGGAIEGATADGMTKSVPYEIAITPIWYNEALFVKAGVKEFPKSIDDLWDAADKLKAAGIIPTSQMTGGSNAWTSMLWYSHIVASVGGPNIWDKPITDPVFVQAAEILLKMYSDGNTSKDAIGGDAGVSGGHYLAGRSAMFLNGPWYIGRVRDEAPDVYKNTGIASLPAAGKYPGAQVGFPLSNLAAAYTDDPDRKEAVMAFMKWMTKPDHVKRISIDSGALFAVKYQLSDADIVDPLQKKFMEAASGATFIGDHFAMNYESDVVAEFGQALSKMALGKATPEEFVQQIASLVK